MAKTIEQFPPPPWHHSHPVHSDGTGQLQTTVKGIGTLLSVGLCENLHHSSFLEWKETALPDLLESQFCTPVSFDTLGCKSLFLVLTGAVIGYLLAIRVQLLLPSPSKPGQFF